MLNIVQRLHYDWTPLDYDYVLLTLTTRTNYITAFIFINVPLILLVFTETSQFKHFTPNS